MACLQRNVRTPAVVQALQALTLHGSAALLLVSFLPSGGLADQPKTPVRSDASRSLSASDVYQRVSPSVVTIVVSGRDGRPAKTGSGVVISSEGWILTNYHVVQGGTFFDVKIAGEEGQVRPFSARPKACAQVQDLAIIEVVSPRGLKVARRAASDPKIGEAVYAIGSPLQLEGTLTNGVVSQRRELGAQRLIQTTAAISPGSSGGGLFNARGELVGVTTLSLSDGQSLNFAVSLSGLAALTPCDEFAGALEEDAPESPPPPPSPPKKLPCSAPPVGIVDVVIEFDQPYSTLPYLDLIVSGYAFNTGCQPIRNVTVMFEVFRRANGAVVDVASGSPADFVIPAGRKSFFKFTKRLRAPEGVTHGADLSEVRLEFVDPATGLAIPFSHAFKREN